MTPRDRIPVFNFNLSAASALCVPVDFAAAARREQRKFAKTEAASLSFWQHARQADIARRHLRKLESFLSKHFHRFYCLGMGFN
jgi:hypothetical protein